MYVLAHQYTVMRTSWESTLSLGSCGASTSRPGYYKTFIVRALRPKEGLNQLPRPLDWFQFFTATHFLTGDSTEQAYDQAMDVLLLDRIDKYKSGYSAPFLLGNDQVCYDFLKWYITVPPTHDFSNTSLSFLDIHNANELESVDYVMETDWMDLDLSVLAAMSLLKLRFAVDGMRTQVLADEKDQSNTATTNAGTPNSSHTHDLKFTSSIVANNPLLQTVKALIYAASHSHTLHKLIHHRNKHFFRLLLETSNGKSEVFHYHRECLLEFFQNASLTKGSERDAAYIVRHFSGLRSVTGYWDCEDAG
ncbi:hypothetical protein HK097_005521 [Rhizophlyctis rosea]|uniref:Uncharacterized protein n=1 Tax=Rhizophlyctis rosea TaxID=64517 RepID=A0AAD5SGN7_9FUNG|nr:hypothetical protein HK097_005521 [Rhizophlyctis rosea]